jgi:hypothetical protein
MQPRLLRSNSVVLIPLFQLLARDSDDVRELCCKWGAVHQLLRCIAQPEPSYDSNDAFLLSAVKASASLALSKTARVSFMRLGALVTMHALVCDSRRMPLATWSAVADLILRLANMGISCSQLVALLPPQVAESSHHVGVAVSSSSCSAAALALGDHVSRTWRRLMAEFNSMIKSSRPAQDVLCVNLKNLELKYSLVLVIIGRLLSRLRACDRTDAFLHVRAHMGAEVAAELRQSVIHASLVAYGAVMPLVEKNMVLFNDLVVLAFAEKVLQVRRKTRHNIMPFSLFSLRCVFRLVLRCVVVMLPQDDSALATKWGISMPSAFPYRIADEEDCGGVDICSSGSGSNAVSSAVSPPPESHDLGTREENTRDRDAAVNRQV